MTLGSILLTGCMTPKEMGIGRRPYPDYIAPIAFTDTDKAELLPFKQAHPAVFAKVEAIHQQWSGMHAERRKELEQAISENTKILTTAGFSDDEAKSAVRAQVLTHGWPSDDPLVVAIKQPKGNTQ